MKLDHLETPQGGPLRFILLADAAELAQALQELQGDSPQQALTQEQQQDRLAEAVNRILLRDFPAIYRQALYQQNATAVTDPEFGLRALNQAEGFCATAELYTLPPLALTQTAGFVQAVEPRPIGQLEIEAGINIWYSAPYQEADDAGRQALRQQVIQRLYEGRCQQAIPAAQRKLLLQFGATVTGEIPAGLLQQHTHRYLHQVDLRMQAQHITVQSVLQANGWSEEDYRAARKREAEHSLRAELGLLLLARQEGLWPSMDEVATRYAKWDPKRDGEQTFIGNDLRRLEQQLARRNATAWLLKRAQLTPPPTEPVLA